MKRNRTRDVLFRGFLMAVLICVGSEWARTQSQVYERNFPQRKAAVEKALKDLQSSLAGRLPTLDGFAVPGEHPLDRYQRGYYQSTVQVSSTAAGGSIVRVSTKVTAWYTDSAPSRSGYQLLTSNGRLEADLLDQLAQQLATSAAAVGSSGGAAPTAVSKSPDAAKPIISAPMPRFPETGGTFSSSLSQSLSAQEMGSPTQENSCG